MLYKGKCCIKCIIDGSQKLNRPPPYLTSGSEDEPVLIHLEKVHSRETVNVPYTQLLSLVIKDFLKLIWKFLSEIRSKAIIATAQL